MGFPRRYLESRPNRRRCQKPISVPKLRKRRRPDPGPHTVNRGKMPKATKSKATDALDGLARVTRSTSEKDACSLIVVGGRCFVWTPSLGVWMRRRRRQNPTRSPLAKSKPTSTTLLPIRPLTLRWPERSRSAFPEPTAAKKYFRSSFPLTGSSGRDKGPSFQRRELQMGKGGGRSYQEGIGEHVDEGETHRRGNIFSGQGCGVQQAGWRVRRRCLGFDYRVCGCDGRVQHATPYTLLSEMKKRLFSMSPSAAAS